MAASAREAVWNKKTTIGLSPSLYAVASSPLVRTAAPAMFVVYHSGFENLNFVELAHSSHLTRSIYLFGVMKSLIY